MKGRRYTINVDRLEICYTAPKNVIDRIESSTHLESDGYSINFISGDSIESLFLIDKILDKDSQTPKLEPFARLRIGNSFEKEEDTFRYCWISIENKALYDKDNGSGFTSLLGWIEYDLGLSFHNVKDIEIAMDSNISWFRRVKSAIRKEEITPIVLGKAYKDMEEIIAKLLYIHTGDRKRYRTDTLVVKGGDASLKLYDKGKEIEESGKEYIREAFGLHKGELFRAEVKVNNRALSEYCASSGCSQYDIYKGILDNNLLFELWLYFSNKLLRFKDKREKVSILQL